MTVLKITELSLPVLLGEMGLERWPSPGKIPRGLGQGDGAGMALPPLGKGKSMGKGSEMPTRGWFCAPAIGIFMSLLHTAAFGMGFSWNSCGALKADLDSQVTHKM